MLRAGIYTTGTVLRIHWDYNLSILFGFLEELFCFDSRVVALKKARGTESIIIKAWLDYLVNKPWPTG